MSRDQNPEFKFAPDYAETIAHVATTWATMEYYVNDSIWRLADLPMGIGACITTQIFTLQGRLSALLALLKLRGAPGGIVSRVNKFSESVRGPTEDRNRIIHDVWLIDRRDPDVMARLEITASKKLRFETVPIAIGDLKAAHGRMAAARSEMFEIRQAIIDLIPTLPEVPGSARDPIPDVR